MLLRVDGDGDAGADASFALLVLLLMLMLTLLLWVFFQLDLWLVSPAGHDLAYTVRVDADAGADSACAAGADAACAVSAVADADA